MFIIYKDRGILIPVYFILSIIGTMIIFKISQEYLGANFVKNFNYQIVLGVGILMAGVWTYFTSGDYINVNGKKEKIDLNNHFFFINMEIWSYIFFIGGVTTLISGILETINK